MIASLRHKFIAVAMVSIIVVLGMLIGTIDLANFASIRQNADDALDLLVSSGMFEPDEDHPYREGFFNPVSGEEAAALNNPRGWIAAVAAGQGEAVQTTFESQYFSVIENSDKTRYRINPGTMDQLSSKQAINLTRMAAGGKNERGFAATFRYYKEKTPSGGTQYYFLDCSSSLTDEMTFISVTLLIFVAGVLAFFIMVWVLSKSVVYPVAESYAKQKKFITNAGHELKTPLAIIDSCTDVIEMENGESKWTEGIHGQVERLSAMTQELITMAKFEENDTNMERAEFNLTESMHAVLDPFALMAEEQGLGWNVTLQDNVMFYGNEKNMQQVCSILADNAIKYAKENTTVAYMMTAHRNRIKIVCANEVEDGIRKGSHEEFFDRFYRGDESRSSEKKGYGIGLSMARTIVGAHGGKIVAVSDDGKILRMEITLQNRSGQKLSLPQLQLGVGKLPKEDKKS